MKMISWFKKHFIPHEGNNHRPHLLRKESTKNIILAILLLELFVFLAPTMSRLNTKIGNMAAVLSAVLTDLTNEERTGQKLDTLTINPILSEAAEMKAKDMATKEYFAHTSPEGKTPWYWLEQVGYEYQYAGENLAINFDDSKDVVDAWMKSPSHKANISKDKYTEIGTGIATGTYNGKKTVFVAQVYASPLVKTVSAKTTTTPGITKVVNNNPSENTKILGAETESLDTTNQIATETKTPDQKPTFWEKIIASPRHSTNIIYYVVFVIILISLLLNVFIKIKHHHPDLIINGLIVLVFVGAITSVNYLLTHKNMTVSQSLEYSNESKPL